MLGGIARMLRRGFAVWERNGEEELEAEQMFGMHLSGWFDIEGVPISKL
jgi:hypothetical protein